MSLFSSKLSLNNVSSMSNHWTEMQKALDDTPNTLDKPDSMTDDEFLKHHLRQFSSATRDKTQHINSNNRNNRFSISKAVQLYAIIK